MPGAKHWSVTPSGRLLSSLTVFIYQKFESGPAEGGWRDFFNEHCALFLDPEEDGKGQSLECFNLFKQFEAMLEDALTDFAKQEGKDIHEIHNMIGEVDETNSKASKFLKKLLLAFEYSKFSQLMRDRAKIREDLAADSSCEGPTLHMDTTQVEISTRSESKTANDNGGEEEQGGPSQSRDYKRDSKEAWV